MRDLDFWMLADDGEPARGQLLAALGEDETFGFQSAVAEGSGAIDYARILVDRPDVLAAYYAEFFGPLNDRNSDAWLNRVGGEAPEDYARYWYDAHGRAEGYVQDAPPLSSPSEGGGAHVGRVTYDGVPISQILADRPDVFQAFFTEYYGTGNDRNSDAWVQRVGGTTVEDYADYWYRAHGKVSGYAPSVAGPPAIQEPLPEPPLAGPGDDDPAPGDDAVADPTPADPAIDAAPFLHARPLVVTFVDGQLTVEPATDAQIASMRSLFDDTAF